MSNDYRGAISIILVLIVVTSAFVAGLYLRGDGSTHVPGDTPPLYDASWYYYKVEDKVFCVVILRDGTHTLIEESVLEDLP